MAYCAVADVQSIFKSMTFATDTKVTTTEITNTHIPQADSIIDSHLRKVYSVPLTDATDLVLLKHISMNLTAGIVGEILFETTNNPNENNPARDRFERGMALLNQIISGEVTLVTSKSDVIYSRVEDLYEEQDQDELEPIVTISKEF